jgi:hypothetical protein
VAQAKKVRAVAGLAHSSGVTEWTQRRIATDAEKKKAPCQLGGPSDLDLHQISDLEGFLRVGQSGIDAIGERTDVVAHGPVGAIDHDG